MGDVWASLLEAEVSADYSILDRRPTVDTITPLCVGSILSISEPYSTKNSRVYLASPVTPLS